MNDLSETGSGSLDALVADVVDQFMERVHRGEQPRIEEYAARHPEAAALLRQILPALQVLQSPADEVAAKRPGENAGTLGDFRILREVGRGGMGIVYEAEQISLGRRVALKVLPFAATLDPRQLQRFHNEARAAASLHHEHIVPVHAVGQERGVHFFAMQFIDGRTLADLIAQERRGTASPDSDKSTAVPGVVPAAETKPVAETTTAPPPRAAAYCRQVAAWGIQAADALEHAHSLGIVHRDIKPSNLMIDAQGQLWIADFGLARRAAESDLTITGDLLGTLRYMSPEQALAKHDLVDHRSDVYSLGATLYELLALRPAAEGKDRQEIIEQITHTDATGLRRHDRGIPADLETIVLKALAKEPESRYATAMELADDLGRFLDDKPIRARRPSLTRRLGKWGQRNRPTVIAATVAAFVITTVLGAAAGLWYQSELDRSASERDKFQTRQDQLTKDMNRLLDEVDNRLQAIHAKLSHPIKVCELLSNIDDWRESLVRARFALRHAKDLAASNDDILPPELAQRLQQVDEEVEAGAADWNTAKKLDNIRIQESMTLNWEESPYLTGPKYEKIFRDLGFDWRSSTPAQIASKIQQTRLRYVLVGALDDWSIKSKEDGIQQSETARLADPDPWRDKVREEKNWHNLRALETLAKEVDIGSQSPHMVAFLSCRIARNKGDATSFIRSALMTYPRDFTLHVLLGNFLSEQNPDQSIGCFQAALALRPNSNHVHNNLGLALINKKDLDGAIRHFRKAAELAPTEFRHQMNLGKVLSIQGNYDGAVEHYRKALELDPNILGYHKALAFVLADKGDLKGALEACRKALALDPDDPDTNTCVGYALFKKRDLDLAIDHLRMALKRKPSAKTHNYLAQALSARKDFDGAIEEDRKALKLDPKYWEAHFGLGTALLNKEEFSRAIFHLRTALEINPDYPQGNCNLGHALRQTGEFADALKYLQRGHEFGAKEPDWPYESANWVKECKRLVKADQEVLAVLRGDIQPADRRQFGPYIAVCRTKKAYANAVQLWHLCFSKYGAETENPNDRLLFEASRDAALAMSLDQSSGAARGANSHVMRKQAYEWLNTDLDWWSSQFKKKGRIVSPELAETLSKWQQASELDTLRDKRYLAKLPQRELEAWEKLWADVEILRKQADSLLKETKRFSGAFTRSEYKTVHEVELRCGTTYVIDVRAKNFAPFLRVEDGLGKRLGETRFRIQLTPNKDGVYHLVTSAVPNSGIGDYTLTIREFVTKSEADYFLLGIALGDRGDIDGAIYHYRKALEIRSDYPEASCNLGHALKNKGEFTEALKYMQRGHELGSKHPDWRYPSANWVQDCRRLVNLDREIPDVIKGEVQPQIAQQWEEYIGVCKKKKDYASAVQLWKRFLSKYPTDAKEGRRFHASWDAALALCQDQNAGAIKDASNIALRKQAYEWLHADLDSWSKQFDKRQLDLVPVQADILAHWQKNRNLACLRDEEHLDKFPEVERKSWQKLWADVENLRKQADGMFKETTRLSGKIMPKERQTVHEVKLRAGTMYVIYLKSKEFDTFLVLKDATGKTLLENDDIIPAVDTNSRLIFTPKEDGVYRLVASAFENSGVGRYTLTIREFIK
jgi:serine/threonine protein kinase/Flp pilus assembly protein TadD